MINTGIRLGADIGGSHITVALVDVAHRGIVPGTVQRINVDSKASSDEIISCWADALKRCMQLAVKNIDSLGIAMPGPFDYDAGISLMKENDKYEALFGLNIKEILSEVIDIPVQHIRISNDAACFLRGEVLAGSLRHYQSAMGITLGTGLGTSFYKDGQAVDADLWCAPFRDGIAEDYISTRWFLKRYYELTGQQVANVKLLSQMHDQCRHARQVFDEFACNLAEFISLFGAAGRPDIIVMGGNIAKAATHFFPGTQKNLLAMGIHIPVHMAALGEDALIFGAAL